MCFRRLGHFLAGVLGIFYFGVDTIPELLSEIVYMDIAIAVSDLALMGGWPDGTLRVRRSEQVKLYF